MPPKAKKPPLHVLAPLIPAGFTFTDNKKREFKLGKQFATGGFGRIYICNETGKKEELAIKIEPSGNGPLFTEVAVFQRILLPQQIKEFASSNKLKTVPVPSLVSNGIFDYKGDKLRYLVMPKYSTSLEAVREKNGGVLSAKDTLQVARCVMVSLEYVHGKEYTHADVKAANILLAKDPDCSTSVLVDFGLARLSKSNEDKPDKKRAHNGTAIFTSLDAHRGCHPSYRGDVEILAYNVIYWLTGTLPWLKLESDPAKVMVEKEKMLKSPDATVKQLLSSHPSCIPVVCALFDAALKTGYTKHVDHAKLVKVIDAALGKAPSTSTTRAAATPTKKAGRGAKRDSEEMVPETPEEREEREEQSKSKRGRVGKAAPVKEEAKVTEKKKPLRAAPRRRVIVESSEEDEGMEEEGEEEEREVMPAARRRAPPRIRAGADAAGPSDHIHVPLNSPPRASRRAMGVVPGLANRLKTSPRISPRISPRGKDSPVSATSPPKQGRSAGRLSFGTKCSPSKLRASVPGVQNFAKGRRSIVVDQISRKYKRIAAKKKVEVSSP